MVAILDFEQCKRCSIGSASDGYAPLAAISAVETRAVPFIVACSSRTNEYCVQPRNLSECLCVQVLVFVQPDTTNEHKFFAAGHYCGWGCSCGKSLDEIRAQVWPRPCELLTALWVL